MRISRLLARGRGGNVNRGIILVAVLILAAFSACKMPSSVELQSFRLQRFYPVDSTGWQIECESQVLNPNARPVKLERAELRVWLAGSQLATLTLQQEVLLESNTSKLVQLPVSVKLRSPADALRLGVLSLQSLTSKIEVDGKVHAKYGWWPYTKRLKRQPLQQIIDQYGGDQSDK